MQAGIPYGSPQVSNNVPIAEEQNISWADSIERRFRIVFFILAVISILLVVIPLFVMLIGI
jgi:hypothetical protein